MELSSSRGHQLLHTDEVHQIPEWLNSQNEPETDRDKPLESGEQSLSPRGFQAKLANEVEVLRWCIQWLEQLSRGERVVVNLRAESDPRTAYVGVEQGWVMRVLKQIVADLDRLSGPLRVTEARKDDADPIAAGVDHRRRLAEPEPQWSSLSQHEQRAILREKIGLPPL